MNQPNVQNIIAQMQAATLAGAKTALEIREQPDFTSRIKKKPNGTYVTPGDEESEKKISGMLRQVLPQAAFQGEEGTTATDHNAALKWVVDPIDGTGNFIRGADKIANPLPETRSWGVSIGLKENGESVLATLFIPTPDATSAQLDGVLYTALTGQPTYAIPVEKGELKIEKGYLPGQKPGHAKSFSLGAFPDSQPEAASDVAVAASCPAGPMGSFCASAMQVVEGNGACLNGINCEWDSAAAYLLLKQAGRPVIEFANGRDAENEPRYTTIAAATPEQFKALNDAYAQHTAEMPLRHANLPGVQRVQGVANSQPGR